VFIPMLRTRCQRMEDSISALGVCLHTSPTREYPHGQYRTRTEPDNELLRIAQRDMKQRSTWPSDRVGYMEKDTR
jgi:cell division control protein 7